MFDSKQALDIAWSLKREAVSYWFEEVAPLIMEDGLPHLLVAVELVGVNFFKALGGRWRSLVALSEDTRCKYKFDIARMFIRVISPLEVPESIMISSNGKEYMGKDVDQLDSDSDMDQASSDGSANCGGDASTHKIHKNGEDSYTEKELPTRDAVDAQKNDGNPKGGAPTQGDDVGRDVIFGPDVGATGCVNHGPDVGATGCVNHGPGGSDEELDPIGSPPRPLETGPNNSVMGPLSEENESSKHQSFSHSDSGSQALGFPELLDGRGYTSAESDDGFSNSNKSLSESEIEAMAEWELSKILEISFNGSKDMVIHRLCELEEELQNGS
ncbi:hypothetical protein V6N13_055132 [Hibiscus sabdariffa]|uniref:Uncharacterized protein n=1 Tax=Hibiscus sabdariffa TaxID=183260 RepID=A0ABR2DVL8_9ROSI